MVRKSIVLVPARGGSISIKKKNLQTVNGVPLVCRSIKHGISLIDDDILLCVSSDDTEILSTSIEFIKESSNNCRFTESVDEFQIQGNMILHKRPPSLAKSGSSTWHLMEYLQESLRVLSGIEVSKWLILQPTTPFRKISELNRFKELINSGSVEDLISVRSLGDIHPNRMVRIGRSGMLKSVNRKRQSDAFVPRQKLNSYFLRDGGFYLIDNKRFTRFGPTANSFTPFIREFPFYVNIDEQPDLVIAKSIPFSLYSEDPNEHT